MAFTGQLGTTNSMPGNIELGAVPSVTTGSIWLRWVKVVVPWYPLPFLW